MLSRKYRLSLDYICVFIYNTNTNYEEKVRIIQQSNNKIFWLAHRRRFKFLFHVSREQFK